MKNNQNRVLRINYDLMPHQGVIHPDSIIETPIYSHDGLLPAGTLELPVSAIELVFPNCKITNARNLQDALAYMETYCEEHDCTVADACILRELVACQGAPEEWKGVHVHFLGTLYKGVDGLYSGYLRWVFKRDLKTRHWKGWLLTHNSLFLPDEAIAVIPNKALT